MTWQQLFNQAHTLCVKTERYEIIPELVVMNEATLSELISFLTWSSVS